MVASGFENKLKTAAMSRANVSSFYPQLEEIRAERNRLLGEEEAEEEIPLVEVDSYELDANNNPSFSVEDIEKIKKLGVPQFRIIDDRGEERIINIPQENVSTPPPAPTSAPKPDPKNDLKDPFDSLFGEGSIAESQSKPKDRKKKVEDRINFFQEQLNALGPAKNRELSSKKKERKRLKDAIKKNKEILSKL
jgi:hypothetical protein